MCVRVAPDIKSYFIEQLSDTVDYIVRLISSNKPILTGCRGFFRRQHPRIGLTYWGRFSGDRFSGDRVSRGQIQWGQNKWGQNKWGQSKWGQSKWGRVSGAELVGQS